MADCLIGLGANLGDRAATLAEAISLLRADVATTRLATSAFHETAAVGGPHGQPVFLNAAVRLETSRSVADVFALLMEIERRFGRRRDQHWGPRTIDLDLLLYGREIIDTREVVVPHPRMAFRRFVLGPAAEVAADMVHPVVGWTIGQLRDHLDSAEDYIALAGLSWFPRIRLRDALSARSWQLICRGELQSLQSLADLLARPNWPRDIVVVSDFWFGELLAAGQASLLGAARRAEYERAWSEANQAVMPPKLIVWLDAPEFTAPKLHDAVAAQLTAPGTGPVLRLTTSSEAELVGELEAAAAGMRRIS